MPVYQAKNYVTARQIFTQEDFDAWLAELTPEQIGGITDLRADIGPETMWLRFTKMGIDGPEYTNFDADTGGWFLASALYPETIYPMSDENFQNNWMPRPAV